MSDFFFQKKKEKCAKLFQVTEHLQLSYASNANPLWSDLGSQR